jgi:hypothetical protein
MNTYLIGTDEAGYGPNLGPLVVSATAWKLSRVSRDTNDRNLSLDLWPRLHPVVIRPTRPLGKSAMSLSADAPLEIGDSKQLYASGSSLGPLERGVLAHLALLGPLPRSWEEAWEALHPESSSLWSQIPWWEDRDRSFPLVVNWQQIQGDARRLANQCDLSNVSLVALSSRAIFPEQWNELLVRWGSKGEVLSRLTLELVHEVIDELLQTESGEVIVHCDKHGGRNRYGGLLQAIFPEVWLETVRESRECSQYRCGEGEQKREFHFTMRGEENLAVALASMASKYLRELAMEDFNAFWTARLPQLRPTAGYPQDARRFLGEITQLQQELGIPSHQLWRMK